MAKTIDVPLLHLLAFSTRCAEFTSFDLVRFSLSLAAVEKVSTRVSLFLFLLLISIQQEKVFIQLKHHYKT